MVELVGVSGWKGNHIHVVNSVVKVPGWPMVW